MKTNLFTNVLLESHICGMEKPTDLFKAMLKIVKTVVSTVIILVLCIKVEDLIYEPPAVMVYTINGEYDSLAGNAQFPNTVHIVADTIRMYFYSTDFDEINSIRHGDLIRLDIFPFYGNIFGTKNILFHMARYHDGNASYTVNPADSLLMDNSVQMRADVLERFHGGIIRISNIFITSEPIPGTASSSLSIQNGRIEGRIP